jgi:hypothetical protein
MLIINKRACVTLTYGACMTMLSLTDFSFDFLFTFFSRHVWYIVSVSEVAGENPFSKDKVEKSSRGSH